MSRCCELTWRSLENHDITNSLIWEIQRPKSVGILHCHVIFRRCNCVTVLRCHKKSPCFVGYIVCFLNQNIFDLGAKTPKIHCQNPMITSSFMRTPNLEYCRIAARFSQISVFFNIALLELQNIYFHLASAKSGTHCSFSIHHHPSFPFKPIKHSPIIGTSPLMLFC